MIFLNLFLGTGVKQTSERYFIEETTSEENIWYDMIWYI